MSDTKTGNYRLERCKTTSRNPPTTANIAHRQQFRTLVVIKHQTQHLRRISPEGHWTDEPRGGEEDDDGEN